MNKNNGSGITSLLAECVLSIIAIVAISFLPTLHLYSNNVGELTLGSLMGSVYLFSGIGICLFIVLRILFRKHPYFAGCLTTLIVFLAVNFNLLSTPFKLVFSNYMIANVLAIVVLVLFIAGGWALLRKFCSDKQNGRAILLIISIVCIGLILFNCLQLAVKVNSAKQEVSEKEQNVAEEVTEIQVTAVPTAKQETESESSELPEMTVAETPDPYEGNQDPDTASSELLRTPDTTEEPFVLGEPNIYFIVFDEYASMGAMEQYYDYNSDSMREFMKSVGINWSEHSYSMTRETRFSMTDLNMMDYVSYRKGNAILRNYRQHSAIKDIWGNQLQYKLYQYSTTPTWFGYMSNLRDQKIKQAYKKTTSEGVESDQIVKDNSLIGAFESIFGALTPQSQIEGESESLSKYGYYSSEEIQNSSAFKKNSYNNDIKHILEVFDFFENEENFKSTEKRAVFSYVKCPHVPFFFDQLGQVRSFNVRMNWNNPDLYRDQYIYVTKHIVSIFKTIISADPNSIIIVMSDHGVREHGQGFVSISPKDDCWVFMAVYYAGQPLDIEEMSPINVLRLITTNLGVNMAPVRDYVTIDSLDDLSDVNYNR